MKDVWDYVGRILTLIVVMGGLTLGGLKIQKSIYDDGFKAGVERGQDIGEARFTGKLLSPEDGKALEMEIVGREVVRGGSQKKQKDDVYFKLNNCSGLRENLNKKVVMIGGSCRFIEER